MKPSIDAVASLLNDPRVVRWLRTVGVFVLVVGVAACAHAGLRNGSDFACVYFSAVGLVEAAPVYDYAWQHAAFPGRLGIGTPAGMFYPPATGLAILPFGVLPYPIARVVWCLLMCATVILGVRAVVRLSRPQTGDREWPLIAGVILLSAALRWGMTPLQGAPLILGVLGLFAVALHQRQVVLAVVLATFAASFKPTLSLPFLGLLFLYRHYLGAAIAVGVLALANVAAFARLGGMSAWRAYQGNVVLLENLADINTPDPWSMASVPRLDWTYLFYGVSRQLQASRLAALLCCAAVGLWLAWQAYKVKAPSLASLGAFMLAFACLTNLVVYHHQYDVSLVIVPMLVLALGSMEFRKSPAALRLMLPQMMMMAVVPAAMAQRFFSRHFGVIGRGLINLTFTVALTLTLFGAILIIRRLASEHSPNVDEGVRAG